MLFRSEPSAAFAAPTQSLADAGRGGEELLTLEDQLQANPIAGELSTTTGAVATTPRPPVLSDEAAADTVQTETSTAPPGRAVAEAAPAAVTGGGNQLMNGFVIAALLLSGCWVLAKSVTVSQRSSAERPVEAIPLPVSGPVQQAAFVASIVQPQPVVNYPPLPAAVTVPPAPMQQVPMQQVPMQQVPGRLDEIPRDQPVVVVCHHGMRSLQVAHFLAAQGYADVANLTGGIDAWSRSVDPTVPT